MRQNTRALVRAVAGFGERYHAEYLADWVKREAQLRSDWWEALRFWFDRSFYQGRQDVVSEKMEKRALEALSEQLGDSNAARSRVLREILASGWLSGDRWENRNNPLQLVLRKHGVNKRYDRLLVIGTLGLTSELQKLNIAEWAGREVRAGRLSKVYRRLDQLPSVGDKIGSFFLRDLVDVLDLRAYVKRADRLLLQPVDTWVRQVARKIGIRTGEGDLTGMRKAVVAACDDADADPIRFNQGAWYLGSHSLDIAIELVGKLTVPRRSD